MKRRILMVTSELFPLAKAGGLADAVADLSTALAGRGHDVRVVLPRYYFIDREDLHRLPLEIHLDPEGSIPVYETRVAGPGPGATVYLLDYEAAYGRDGIYTTADGNPFEDNVKRFSLLSRAALELCRALGWRPDVFHGHDWPTGLIPVYLQDPLYRDWFPGSATVFTIHNLGYQGTFPFSEVSHLGIAPGTVLTSGLMDGRHISFLRSALSSATALTTVSPTYAMEIDQPEYGLGLEPVLRQRTSPVRGILNGIDYDTWNPATDPLIPLNYDENDLRQKALLRRVLRWYVGLPQDDEVPLVGMITRMVEQKGFAELLSQHNPTLVRLLTRRRVQLVMLGSGPAARERVLRELAGGFSNLAVVTGFDNQLAHLIEAASDFFLMPSRYEPCGLNQMYSLRYGTVPIVTRTGGLVDTVVDIREDEERGTGYLIPRSSPRDIFDTVSSALDDFESAPERITAARLRGMKQRFTWESAAVEYEEVYRDAVERSAGEASMPN
ncbi:MAG: glycosyltransferase [Spirochaetes bacterium]|jgi:starch synthase|nr:glycosyltransferase [Spirochaetota bacterium]